MKMIVKKHITFDKRLILAVCDSGLKGKVFEENRLRLDLSISFYNGEEMDESQTAELFKAAYIINLAGKNSVQLALKEGIIKKGNVVCIKGVPNAQALMTAED